MAKILVADDDKDLGNLVAAKLRDRRHVVDLAVDGDEARLFVQTYTYDLLVLDVNMPGRDGFEVLAEVRKRDKKTKVIMLTDRSEVEDKLAGFEKGTDDYLCKPFDSREFLARVDAILARPENLAAQVLTCGNINLDLKSFELRQGGELKRLQPRDMMLLEFLMRHPNEVFSNEALLDRVWGSDSCGTVEGLRMSVSRLRRALDANAQVSMIQSVNRIGYRLNPDGPGGPGADSSARKG